MSNNRSESDRPPRDRPPPSRRPAPGAWRFGLGRLLLVMTVLCVLGAAVSYGARAIEGQLSMRLVLILFSLAAPGLLLIVVSLCHALLARSRKRRRN